MTLRAIEHSMRVCVGHDYNGGQGRCVEQVCRAGVQSQFAGRLIHSFIPFIFFALVQQQHKLLLLYTFKAVTVHISLSEVSGSTVDVSWCHFIYRSQHYFTVDVTWIQRLLQVTHLYRSEYKSSAISDHLNCFIPFFFPALLVSPVLSFNPPCNKSVPPKNLKHENSNSQSHWSNEYFHFGYLRIYYTLD